MAPLSPAKTRHLMPNVCLNRYISIKDSNRFFILKKMQEKNSPYFLLAFLMNETKKAFLSESLLTFKLRQRYRTQNHHMLGCIA
jgi:hypothetical protein